MRRTSPEFMNEIAARLPESGRIALEMLRGAVDLILLAQRAGHLTKDLELTWAGRTIKPDKKGRVRGYQPGLVKGPECLLEEIRFFRSEAALACLNEMGIGGLDQADIIAMISQCKERRAASKPEPPI